MESNFFNSNAAAFGADQENLLLDDILSSSIQFPLGATNIADLGWTDRSLPGQDNLYLSEMN